MYEADIGFIGRLGALQFGGDSSMIVPTIYVIGADQLVHWNDSNARFLHEPASKLITRLEHAIETALQAAPN